MIIFDAHPTCARDRRIDARRDVQHRRPRRAVARSIGSSTRAGHPNLPRRGTAIANGAATIDGEARSGGDRGGPVPGLWVIAITAVLLAGWGAGELSGSALQSLDLYAVQHLAAAGSEPLTSIARALSLAGSIVVIALLAVVCCAALYRGAHRAALLVALSGPGAIVLFNVEKLIVGRPRPPIEQLVSAPYSSFPSGHATLAAAFYAALLIVFLARRPPLAAAIGAVTAIALLVAGVSLSRVYLGVHYPSDVTGGVLLGVSWTFLVALSMRHPIRRRHRPGNQDRPPGAMRLLESQGRGSPAAAGAT